MAAFAHVAAAIVAFPVAAADRPEWAEGSGSAVAAATVRFEESVTGGGSATRDLTTMGEVSAVPGDLYLCVVSARRVREVESVTGFGLTWTRVRGQCAGNAQTCVEVWRGEGTPTAGPVTARLNVDTRNGVITVARFAGADPWAPVGAVVGVNTNGPGGDCTDGVAREEFGATLADVRGGSTVLGCLATRAGWPTPGTRAQVVERRYWGSGIDVTGVTLIGLPVESPGDVTLEGVFDRWIDWALVAVEIRPIGTTPPPHLRLASGDPDFGTVFVAGSEREKFEIANVGARDLEVSSVAVVGPDAEDFVIESPGPFTVRPGRDRDVFVRFAPRSGGAKAAVLRILSDDPERRRFDLPLSGEGDELVPVAGIDRPGHDFGEVLLAPSSPLLRDHVESPGPPALHVDPDHPAWFLDAEGRPKFICGPGDPEGFLYRDGNDQDAIIDALVASGANSIYFTAIRSHGGDGESDENPFVDHDPSRGLDPAVLDRWDAWFTRLDAAGIVMFLFFYDDAVSVWDTGDAVGAEEESYFTGIVNRFERHENLVWVIAEEYEESLSRERVSTLAGIVAGEDDRGHPIGVHQQEGLEFDFAGDEHVSVFLIQDNDRTAGDLNADMNAAFSGGTALVMSESLNHYWDETGHLVPLGDFRRKNWAVGMGGASSMALRMFVAPEQWPPASYLRACGLQVEFFERTNFPDMVPANGLARLDTDYVLADHAGESFILYAADGDELGLDREAGIYDLLWFDPETGQEVQADGVPCVASFVKPAGFGDEVALWVRSVAGTASAVFELRNDGVSDLELTGTSIAGPDAGDFEVIGGVGPAVIPPGSTRGIEVGFSPTVAGPRGATLRIVTNDPDDPVLEAALLGWGLASVPPDIAGSPASCDFGPVEIGGSMPRSLQIRNDGASDLHVGATGLSGSEGNEFRLVVGGGPFTLAPGAVRQIDVSFEPTAVGSRQGTLRLTSDDPDRPHFEIPLVGTGVASLGETVRFEESVTGAAADTRTVTTAESLLGVSGDVYVAAIATRRVRSVTSLTGLGLEWRRVRAQCSARSQTGVEIWIAQGEAFAGPVTARLDHGTKNATIAVARYSGVHAWAPLGAVSSANTTGIEGSCGAEGVDTPAYALPMASLAAGARLVGAVAARQRIHAPGEGLTVREDVRIGDGADMASVVLVDRPVVVDGASAVDGEFDREADWAIVGLELRPVGSAPRVPDVTVNVASLDLSTVALGDPVEASFSVHNRGSAPLEVFGTNVLGPAEGEFSVIDGEAPYRVEPGGYRPVVVRFCPAAVGERTAVLRLDTDDPDEGRVHVTLSGTGTARALPTVILRETVTGTASGSGLVTTSGTLGGEEGDVFVAVVSAANPWEPVTQITGLGLTWMRIRDQCGGLARTGLEIWLGRGAPVTGSVSVSLGGLPRNVVLWVGRYSGADPMTPIGAVMSANTGGIDGACEVGEASASYFELFPASHPNATVIGAVAKRARSHVPGEDWTSVATVSEGGVTNAAGLAIVERRVEEPGPVAFDGTFDEEVLWAVAAIELLPAEETEDPATDAVAGERTGAPLFLEVRGNPSRTGTPADLRFALPGDGPARLEVFDVRGRRVRTLLDGSPGPGFHRVIWRGDDARGRPLGSGVYFLRLSTGSGSVVRKVTRVR